MENNITFGTLNQKHIKIKRKRHGSKKVYNEMNIIDDNITLESMKIKIHTIRSQFKRELKLILKSKKSGASTSDVYSPKLWCFQILVLPTFATHRVY